MPEVSRFYGIRILIYYRDHMPPHFHAEYRDDEAVFGLPSLLLIEGALTPRARGLVVEWASEHQQELVEAWERAYRGLPPGKIAPLG